MKRCISLFLTICLLLTLCACSGAKSTIETEDNVTFSTEGMTDLQKAIVITAESYYLRGNRVQYDQTSLTKTGTRSIGRRSTATRKPEDYTAQYFGYHDCSSFVFDVYWSALGMDFSESSSKRNTKWFMSNPTVVLSQQVQDQNLTAEQIEEKKQELLDTLQPGDIINYRKRGNGAGHAMLYVGNDTLIHSQGGDYDGLFDKRESNGTYTVDKLSELLLTPGRTRYLFKTYGYVVLRPLDSFKEEIPADTLARTGVMRGIMAEKLASHTLGQTVSEGGEVTFTFHMENRSTAEKSLTVTDTVPAGTTYVSGAETVEGATLTWNVTIPAGESKDVSYTVTVNEGTKTVQSESNISGVAVNCPAVTVAKTLTAEQQQAVRDAYAKHQGKAEGLELASLIYEDVLGYTKFRGVDSEALIADVYKQWNDSDFDLNPQSQFANAVVPRLYGGIYVVEEEPKDAYRVRLLEKHHLVAGDLIVGDGDTFLFDGEKLYDLEKSKEIADDMLDTFVGYFSFAVIRPSMDT